MGLVKVTNIDWEKCVSSPAGFRSVGTRYFLIHVKRHAMAAVWVTNRYDEILSTRTAE